MTVPYRYDEWDLRDLEASVERIKVMYITERNARRPTHRLWNEYSRKLHALRLRKRALTND